MAELRWVCVLYCTALHVDTGALIFSRNAFGMRSRCVRDACFLPASLHARRQAVGTRTSTVLQTTSIRTQVVLVPGVGRTVLYCTTCRYGSPHFRTGCVRNLFALRSVCVRDSFEFRSGCLPSCLPAPCMRVGRTVLYCTACRYGSPHFRTGCVRYGFAMCSVWVWDSFGIRSGCLPCLPWSRLAVPVGTRTSTVLHTTSTVFVHQSSSYTVLSVRR